MRNKVVVSKTEYAFISDTMFYVAGFYSYAFLTFSRNVLKVSGKCPEMFTEFSRHIFFLFVFLLSLALGVGSAKEWSTH